MKAKEYAHEFLCKKLNTQEEVDLALSDTIKGFINEMVISGKIRKIKTDTTFVSVVKEQCRKWRAFGNEVNKSLDQDLIKLDGFKNYMVDMIPELKGKI